MNSRFKYILHDLILHTRTSTSEDLWLGSGRSHPAPRDGATHAALVAVPCMVDLLPCGLFALGTMAMLTFVNHPRRYLEIRNHQVRAGM